MQSLRATVIAAQKALRGNFELTPRTLAMALHSSRSGTLAVGGLSLLVSTLPLGVAYIGKRIVDAVVLRHAAEAWHWVMVELACVAALSLATQGLGLIRQII